MHRSRLVLFTFLSYLIVSLYQITNFHHQIQIIKHTETYQLNVQFLILLLQWPFLFFLPFQLSAVGVALPVQFYLETHMQENLCLYSVNRKLHSIFYITSFVSNPLGNIPPRATNQHKNINRKSLLFPCTDVINKAPEMLSCRK